MDFSFSIIVQNNNKIVQKIFNYISVTFLFFFVIMNKIIKQKFIIQIDFHNLKNNTKYNEMWNSLVKNLIISILNNILGVFYIVEKCSYKYFIHPWFNINKFLVFWNIFICNFVHKCIVMGFLCVYSFCTNSLHTYVYICTYYKHNKA